jgi:uncharacterized protein (TIGR04255 family)
MTGETFPNLARAPIEEAVIDLRIDGGEDDARLDRLGELADSLATDFPQRRTLKSFEGRLHLDEESPRLEPDGASVLGVILRSEDDTKIVQLKRGAFSFSHLRPYTSWEDLLGEAWALWGRYRELLSPDSVTRVATRFVNRIPLPKSFATEDYFQTALDVAPGIPDTLASFNYFYVSALNERTFANVRLATETVAIDAEQIPVLFDIDCYIPEPRSSDDEGILTDLEALRDLKNSIFFSTLTDALIESFR